MINHPITNATKTAKITALLRVVPPLLESWRARSLLSASHPRSRPRLQHLEPVPERIIIGRVRLEPVSVLRLSYEEGARIAAPGYAIVSAYGGAEGIGYGEGRGTATGRIEGDVVWSNYPRRRSDGQMLPNARGLITTADGGAILFELRGRTIFGDDGLGRQNLVGWFESDHESHRWLNDVVCIAEGMIGAEGMELRVYAGIHDMPAG